MHGGLTAAQRPITSPLDFLEELQSTFSKVRTGSQNVRNDPGVATDARRPNRLPTYTEIPDPRVIAPGFLRETPERYDRWSSGYRSLRLYRCNQREKLIRLWIAVRNGGNSWSPYGFKSSVEKIYYLSDICFLYLTQTYKICCHIDTTC